MFKNLVTSLAALGLISASASLAFAAPAVEDMALVKEKAATTMVADSGDYHHHRHHHHHHHHHRWTQDRKVHGAAELPSPQVD